MEGLGIDLVDEGGVVAVARPAEFLGDEKLEVDDPSHGGKIDDLDTALGTNVLDVADQLPDRSHQAGIVSPRPTDDALSPVPRAASPAPARMRAPPRKILQPNGSPRTTIPSRTAMSVSMSGIA